MVLQLIGFPPQFHITTDTVIVEGIIIAVKVTAWKRKRTPRIEYEVWPTHCWAINSIIPIYATRAYHTFS